MRRIDILSRASRSLRQAKTRTILTSLAIAVGAFTLTVSLAAGAGSRDYTNKLITSNIDPQALFIAKDEKLFGGNAQGSGPLASPGLQKYDPDATKQAGVTVKQLTQADIDILRGLDSLSDVEPVYQVSAKYVRFQGNDSTYTSNIATYGAGILTETAAGNLPDRGEQLATDDIVVPVSYLDTLGISAESMIGKKVTITIERSSSQLTEQEISQAFLQGGAAAIETLTKPESKDFTYTVRAVSEQSDTALSAINSLVLSPNSVKAMAEYLSEGTSNYQKYIAATAVAKDGIDPVEAKNQIESKGYTAQTAEDLQSLIFTIVNILQGIVIGFAIIALIASIFGIINTQYISVLERTQQIGLMKALGMSGKDVAKLFRYEAAWIGFLGGIIGAIVAVVIGTVLNPWISEQLSLGEGNYILIFNILPIVAMIICLIIVAILAGYFPARKAAKLDPIEALRTE